MQAGPPIRVRGLWKIVIVLLLRVMRIASAESRAGTSVPGRSLGPAQVLRFAVDSIFTGSRWWKKALFRVCSFYEA
jgi:hypothetical protein